MGLYATRSASRAAVWQAGRFDFVSWRNTANFEMRVSTHPFDSAIDPAVGLAYARMWGEVTGADMLALVTRVHADPAWQAGFDAIWDCSKVSAHIVLPHEVPSIVADEAASGDGRDVLVESPYVGESAFSHMLAASCRRKGKSMQVFPTLAAGLASLGYGALPDALVTARTLK